MKRIEGIEVLLKSIPTTNEWVDSACLSAVAVIVGCDEDKVSPELVKSLAARAMDETIDMWIAQNGVRTSNEDGVPANRLTTDIQNKARRRPAR